MWIDLPTPIVIAHRGDKTYAPENTLAAFRQAAAKGADAIELDVKLTADGQVIVLHDQEVDRTTNGVGNIKNISFAALRNLDAGSWFSKGFISEKVPTLSEVFETVGKLVHINIELTNYATPWDDLILNVVGLVKKHKIQDRILFSSFFFRNIKKASLMLPDAQCGLITKSGFMGFWGRNFGWRGKFLSLNPFVTDVNPGLVNRIHAAGKLVNAWTVNSEADISEMIRLGVDGFITDDPARVLHMLGRG